jgi:hypothetical protein
LSAGNALRSDGLRDDSRRAVAVRPEVHLIGPGVGALPPLVVAGEDQNLVVPHLNSFVTSHE